MTSWQGPQRGRGWGETAYMYFAYCIVKYIKSISNKPDNFRQLSLVLLPKGRLEFNHDMKIQLSFLFSYVLGSVFHKDKVNYH